MKTLKTVAACTMAAMAVACTGNKETVQVEAEYPSAALCDSVSYYMGVNFGNMLAYYNISTEDIDFNKAVQGAKDFTKFRNDSDSSAIKFDLEKMGSAMQNYFALKTEYEKEYNMKKGQEWLAANALKEGVEVTESGLQFKIIAEGDTTMKPSAQDTVKAIYTGRLIDGTEFDSQKSPVTFPLGEVIPGWTEGMQLIGKGGKIELYVPANLGYGERGAGAFIKPNSTLVFEVELVDVMPFKAAEETEQK